MVLSTSMSLRLTLLQGPLVGEKRSMAALVQEYAQADPTYITKTQAGSIPIRLHSVLTSNSPWRPPILHFAASKVTDNVAGVVSNLPFDVSVREFMLM